MSVQSTARYAGPFAGNGVATIFAFGFKVFAASDIVVASTVTATGVVSNPVNGVDYTVQLNADQNVNPGGNVTFAVAPPATVSFYVTSGIPKAQGSQFPNPGPWNPTTGESAWDKSMAIIQELGQAALLFAPGDVASTHVLPSPAARAGKTLFFDGAGALAIGSLIGAMTTTVIGQIPFGAAANTLAQDANLVWDNVNKRQGIGVAVPTTTLDVLGTGKFSTSAISPLFTNPGGMNVGPSTDSAFSLNIGGVGRWQVDVSAGNYDLKPISGDNTQGFGTAASRIKSGYFGTSVVTPLVGTASATPLVFQYNSAPIFQSDGSNFRPSTDLGIQLGFPSFRWSAVVTPIIDSGTTGSLSLKTNNGTTQFSVAHIAGVDFFQVQSGTGTAQLYGTGASTNVNSQWGLKGTGAHSFVTDIFSTPLTQFQVLHTASASRNITVTGSNGGNPTIGVTAGSLAITPNVVIAGSLNVGNSNATPGSTEIVFGGNGNAILRVRNNANSGDVILAQVATQVANDIVNIGVGGNGVYFKARSGGAAPTTTDLPAGMATVWRDTGGATTKLYYNNAGTIQSVALA